MATEERSAGFIIFCQIDTERQFLVLNHGKHWDFPKGHVENGETDADAARRELAEETGITEITPIDGFAETIDYHLTHPRKGLIHKKVVLFLAQTHSQKVRLSDEHVAYAFLPGEKALDKVTHANARQTLHDAMTYLNMLDTGTKKP